MKNIKYKEIVYPNTTILPEQQKWVNGENCVSIERIVKNGEMASIGWFRIELNDGSFEEVIESVCIVRFTAEKEDSAIDF